MQTSRTITSPISGALSAITALLLFTLVPFGVQGVSPADAPWEYFLFSVTNTLIVISMIHGHIMQNLGIQDWTRGSLPPFLGILGIGIGVVFQFDSLLHFTLAGTIDDMFRTVILFVSHMVVLGLYVLSQIVLAIHGIVPYDRYFAQRSSNFFGSSVTDRVYNPGMRVWPGLMNSKNLKVFPRYLNISIHGTTKETDANYTAELNLLVKLTFRMKKIKGAWTLTDEKMVRHQLQKLLEASLQDDIDPREILAIFKDKVNTSQYDGWSLRIIEILSFELNSGLESVPSLGDVAM